MNKISDLVSTFRKTGRFSELVDAIDALNSIRNGYMENDRRIVDVCGYTTQYVGNVLRRPTKSSLSHVTAVDDKHFFIFTDHYGQWTMTLPNFVVNSDDPFGSYHEYISNERARSLSEIRREMANKISSMQTVIDVIDLELGRSDET